MYFCGLLFLHTYLVRMSIVNTLFSYIPILPFFLNMSGHDSNPYENMTQINFSAYFNLYVLTYETVRPRAIMWDFNVPEINIFLYFI